MSTIRVLIVDDSAVVRQVLSAMFSGCRDITVTAAVADPIFAMQRMKQDWPDVIVLDIEMPRMDGLSFLRKIMAERPTPVIVCSTLTTRGADTTMQAFAAGALSVIAKPRQSVRDQLAGDKAELLRLVRTAASANMGNLRSAPANRPAVPDIAPAALHETTDHVVALGTSTGGTIALERVLSALPPTCPGIVVVQHMPEKFTAAFAQRLNGLCRIEVREAAHGDRVIIGRALIAPGGRHMRVIRSGAHYQVDIRDGPPVNRHKPSVDVLFRSVAQCAGRNAVGIIMTGMGDDGANGLREMREAGAVTLAQDEASCVVFGMPKEAIRADAVDRVVTLNQIATEIINTRPHRRSAVRESDAGDTPGTTVPPRPGSDTHSIRGLK